jgi:hypothetical protein
MAFQYNQVIPIPETYSSGFTGTPNFYCIDVQFSTMLESLAKIGTTSQWMKRELVWARIKPSNITICNIPPGWFALRSYRSMKNMRALSHVLNDAPLLFPTPELAQAAAELFSQRKPVYAWGWVGWTNTVLFP